MKCNLRLLQDQLQEGGRARAQLADATLMMQLGADGVFVGSGIFKSEEPEAMASAIVQAVHNFDNLQILAQASKGPGAAMKGLDAATIPEAEALQTRGW